MITFCLNRALILKLTGILFLALSFGTMAQVFEGYPGGVVEIPLSAIDEDMPELFFNRSKLLIQQNDESRMAIVGIPVSNKLGVAEVTRIENGSHVAAYSIHINAKDYPEERLTIKDTSKVSPQSKDIIRIKKERDVLNEALSNWEYSPIKKVSLTKPVKGRVSSEFGFKRILNGKEKSPHRGIDFAAASGTPINASAQGKVTLVEDLFFTGNTVVVDHGQGWQTIYCHLEKMLVNQGDVVDTKTVLGTVGKTGRATGPHLHFGVILNQVRVDPSYFWNSNN